MPRVQTFFSPQAYKYKIKHLIEWVIRKRFPDYRGIVFAPPGHFYSPLLNVSEIEGNGNPSFDGSAYWEHIDLRIEEQKQLFLKLIPIYKKLSFPHVKTHGYNYYSQNHYFSQSDVFFLSGIIEVFRPRRIIEIGSGFSSAVIIDTIERLGIHPQIRFVEPYPDRLRELLREDVLQDRVLVDIVQNCDLEIYDELESGDILFVDSSHVAKSAAMLLTFS